MDQFMKVLEKGTVVFEEGSEGRAFFYIQSGRVEITRKGSGVVDTLGPGQSFGEYALLKDGDSIRSATVTTLERTVLVELDAAKLGEILDGVPEFVNGLIRSLVNKVLKLKVGRENPK